MIFVAANAGDVLFVIAAVVVDSQSNQFGLDVVQYTYTIVLDISFIKRIHSKFRSISFSQ